METELNECGPDHLYCLILVQGHLYSPGIALPSIKNWVYEFVIVVKRSLTPHI
jgi:hypothetical protein